MQIDRLTSKTHLRTDFIVKNLKQRWQHFEFFFLSKTIFSVFEKKTIEFDDVKKKKRFSHKRHDEKLQKFWRLFEKKKINDWITKSAWTKTKKKNNLLNRELFNVSFSFYLRFTFAFINHCLQHFSFMNNDRFRWISERISQRIQFRLWIDRNDQLHD